MDNPKATNTTNNLIKGTYYTQQIAVRVSETDRQIDPYSTNVNYNSGVELGVAISLVRMAQEF